MDVVALADARDPERFGAKAATLAELAARHRVPPGYAIAASAEGDLRGLVSRAHAELAERLGREPEVAVRSSAIGEDSAGASFAGQHDTILGVRGVDAVLGAITDVVRSATSERAVAYRREKGIEGAPRVAVLVQAMVRADASVIAFTSDPVTGDGDLVVINAARGLGDAMASGEVTPDAVQVRKSDLAVEWRRVAGTGGPAISDDQVREVAGLALALERERGHAVDIEAAFESGTLWLLQCRPVTAVGAPIDEFPLSWPEPGDEKLAWRREDAHHGGANPPLACDYPRHGAAVGMRRRNAKLGPPTRPRFEEFNGWMYVAIQPLAAADVIAREQRPARERRLAIARQMAEDVSPWRRRLDELFARIVATQPSGLSAEDAARAWEELWSVVGDVWEIHMMFTGASYTHMDELAATYERLTGRPGHEALALTAGRAQSLQALQRDLFRLTETARSQPRVASAIAGGVEAVDVLRDLPGGVRFGEAMDAFLERHGHAGQVGEDLHMPAWSDRPALLVREVRRALESAGEDPEVRLAKLLADAEATAERTRALLRTRPADRALFDELLEVALVVGPLTEEHNYWLDRASQFHTRRAVLRFGERLVTDGSVDRADDIWHFYVREAAAALRQPRDLRAFVAERRARHARDLRRRAPEAIGAPGDATVVMAATGSPPTRADLNYRVAQDDARVLKGVAASAGIGRGPARLVRGADELARFHAGDVLVCRSTNVSWVPVFSKAAAIVTEVGGSLSHAAVVARELGVPAVVATGVALSLLTDGEIVEVDGTAGIVRRIGARVEVGA